MAIRETVLFDVCDFKVYEMFSDTAGASAGPSYGPAIDVPGVAGFSGFDLQITSQELKGDCRILAKQGRVDSINASFTYGKLALDVLNAIHDGSLWTSGLDEGFRLKGGAEVKYFKAEAIITGTDSGVEEAKAIFYKAQVSSETLFDQSVDSYGQPKFDVSGIGIDSGPDSAVPPAVEKTLMADVIITAAA